MQASVTIKFLMEHVKLNSPAGTFTSLSSYLNEQIAFWKSLETTLSESAVRGCDDHLCVHFPILVSQLRMAYISSL
jgi:hypothetical protein